MASSDIAGNLRQALHDSLLRAWTHRGPLACALWPASLLYAALFRIRRRLYQWRWFRIERVNAAVIVVGNVVVGGAGKTPTVQALARHLVERSMAVGIVSRGHGRRGSVCLEVMPDSAPGDVGDEPLLLRRSTGVPVFVAGSRYLAAKTLLAQYPQTRIILCDDGLQHYALQRDLELCVFDDRGIGNGWLLPAGPLRENWPRQTLENAGPLLTLHTGTQPVFDGFRAIRALAKFATKCDGSSVAFDDLCKPGARPLIAIAGIAQPEAFFSMLRVRSIPLERTVSLPDHYSFDSINPSIYKGYQLICTEKDAAKLWRMVPDAVAVALEMTLDAAFFHELDGRLSEILGAKLSSTHGHKIT